MSETPQGLWDIYPFTRAEFQRVADAVMEDMVIFGPGMPDPELLTEILRAGAAAAQAMALWEGRPDLMASAMEIVKTVRGSVPAPVGVLNVPPRKP